MLGSDPNTGAHDDAGNPADIIADALAQRFGADALRVAQNQAFCAGQETTANWLAVVERLRAQPDHPV